MQIVTMNGTSDEMRAHECENSKENEEAELIDDTNDASEILGSEQSTMDGPENPHEPSKNLPKRR